MRITKSVGICALMLILGLIASGCSSAPSGIPPAKTGTLLRKIQDRGRLIVGARYDSPLFGFLNQKTGGLEGFDVAVAHEMAAYIFGDPNRIDFKETLSKDRIPFLKDGSVDVVFAVFTINEDRVKEIDFSVVYFVAGQRLLVRQDSPIKSLVDLDASKKVGAAKGSTSIDNLRKQSKAQVVEFDSYAQATNAMLANQLDAVSTDDAILYGQALANPTTKVVGTQFSYEPYGAGIAKGNSELVDVVNTVIKNLKASGKWKALWKSEIGDKLGITTLPDPPADNWK